MLVVITIIGLIMGLVGPRVLNYLTESKVKAAQDPDRELRQRARPVLSRHRPLSDQLRRPAALVQPPGSITAWNGPYLKGGWCRPIPGATLRLPLAGRARRPTTSSPTAQTDRKVEQALRLTSRAGRDDRGAARTASRCSKSSACSRSSRSRAIVLPAHSARHVAGAARGLRGRGRRAAQGRPRRRDPRSHADRDRARRARAHGPLRRDRPRDPRARRCRLRRAACRALQSAAAGPTISFFPSGMSCGGVIALTRLGVGYQIRVNWLTGGVEVVPIDNMLKARRSRRLHADRGAGRARGRCDLAGGDRLADRGDDPRRALDRAALALVETARAIMTGLPDRDELAPGNSPARSPATAGASTCCRSTPIPPLQCRSTGSRRPWWCGCSRPSGTDPEVNTVRLRRRPTE